MCIRDRGRTGILVNREFLQVFAEEIYEAVSYTHLDVYKRQALHAGDLEAGIIASKVEDSFLTEETLFYEQFYAYVSRKEPSFKHEVILSLIHI